MSLNFGVAQIVGAPNPPTTGVTLTVAPGQGARFTVGANASLVPPTGLADPTTGEVVTISAVAPGTLADTITIVRAQESTTANAVVSGDLLMQGITAGMWDALLASVAAKANGFVPVGPKASAYSANPGEFVLVDTTSIPVPITLPTTPAAGTRVGAKLVTQGGTNTSTITCGGADVLNKAGGGTTATLTLLGQAWQAQYQAGVWVVTADDLPLSQLDLRYATPASVASAIASATATLTAQINAALGESAALGG